MKKKYTDRTIITWGEYRFKSLGSVPADYLLEIYQGKTTGDQKLLHYIETNLDRIKAQKEGKITTPPPVINHQMRGKYARLICQATDKIVFATEKIAKFEVRRIKYLEQENNKKPVRAYECEKCGGWHLTSMAVEEWETTKTRGAGNWNAYAKEMLNFYEKETQLLNNKITHHEEQMKLLKEENEQLRETNKQLKKENKDLDSEIRLDKRIMLLEKELYDRRKEVENLKQVNSQLINRLFQVEKRNSIHHS